MTNLLEQLGERAKKVKPYLALLGSEEKNNALNHIAEAILQQKDMLLAANKKDCLLAKEHHMKPALLDRLRLNEERILQMAEGLKQVASLPDPIGQVLSMTKRPNGLLLGKQRVPLGVVGIIYESRPNVTADAFALCFKSGNVAFLRGGSDCFHSNLAIAAIIRNTLTECHLPEDTLLLLEDTSRETVSQFMKLRNYIDVLIPRGGRGLIQSVVENSTIPVIETGTGNCHIYVDDGADLSMAVSIIRNAKTQRIGVCNACESLVVHENMLSKLLPPLKEALSSPMVELRGDEKSRKLLPSIKKAEEKDWGTEYLDYILSIKTVSSIEEAISHINAYNTGHSESIITENYSHARKFLQEVDAACVYVNASTRFTDGFEFGFGAEIGISTQKLHARGPMGLEALTTTKYIIYGDGQIRP